MYGSGRSPPTRPIPDFARPPAPLANTTASSWSISSFCEAAPAPLRAHTCGPRTATSSHPARAGSSAVCASPWISEGMHTKPSASPVLRDYHPAQRLLVADVLEGLRRAPKQISPMYFYDERGSQLFDRICELPEYYLTRTETRVL